MNEEFAKIIEERDSLKHALEMLMPYVLEEYYPDCATPGFKQAVETAKKLLETNERTHP